MIELKDTVDLMLSDDWKKRLVGEYAQTVVRRENLLNYIYYKVDFADMTSEDVKLLKQEVILAGYLVVLEARIIEAMGNEALIGIFEWLNFNEPLTIFDD